jgi:hypothetical protein
MGHFYNNIGMSIIILAATNAAKSRTADFYATAGKHRPP